MGFFDKGSEYSDKSSCCVTHHLVEEVSKAYPKLLRNRKGDLKLHETLYFLGFNINWDMLNKNVSVHEGTLIRSRANPQKCYKTKVYKGFIRNAVQEVVHGEVIYDKNELHHLAEEYDIHEVLQPNDISAYVSEDDYIMIDTIKGE